MSAARLVLLVDVSDGGRASDAGASRRLAGDVAADPQADVAADVVADLAAVLGRLYEGESLEIESEAGGRIRAVLAPTADPFRGLALAVLTGRAGVCAQIEWIAADGSSGGDGPAEPGAEMALTAARGERIAVSTGDAGADSLLADLVPVLIDQLESLTERQREIARLALVEGLRQSEVAQRLGVARATVSISFDRAHVASLRQLMRAMRRIAEAGWTRAEAERGK